MRFLHLVFGVAALAATGAAAEEPLLLREARAAVAEGIPRVAIFKLRALLAQRPIAPADQVEALFLEGQALMGAGESEEALAVLQPLVRDGDHRAIFLRAGVLAGLGRWAEALPLYQTVGEMPRATEGEAEALLALGRNEEAASLLEAQVKGGQASAVVRLRLVVVLGELKQRKRAREILSQVQATTPEEAKWRAYTEGRLLLMDDQAAPALTLLEGVLQDREHLPEALLVAATFAATDARVVLHGSEAADAVLETFIWRYPQSAWLEAAFRRLDQIYAQEEDPPETELHKWQQKPQVRRAALASFYVAKLQVRRRKLEKASASLDYFMATFPQHPLLGQAYALRAEVLSARGDFAESVRALEGAMRLAADGETRAVIEMRTGLADFQAGEFLLAANLFEEAAQRSAKLRAVATFDAALAWLHQRNFERFDGQYRAFIQMQANPALQADLLLEEGLVQARAGDPGAEASLREFTRAFPHAPRQAEARLARWELAFLTGDVSRGGNGAEALRLPVDAPAAPEIAAAADYLAIFEADAQKTRDDERVIALAQKFLQTHPEATQAAEVHLKLGQVYFRREDFANAETQFATLASRYPSSSFAEAALYLAGESAMKLINPGALDRALEFFERVVKLEGRFRLYARQEQAIVQSRLEHEGQAVALYDLILNAQPPADAELREAALCGKGDNLMAQGRRELPKTERLEQAVSVYRQLSAAPDVPAVWRNQALYKLGKALEQLGRGDESLAAYYDVLNRTQPDEGEFFWFYKAGFDAASLCEQQEQWKSAVGIYQKMARIEGPRAAEAQNRLHQIRLEHFLWD